MWNSTSRLTESGTKYEFPQLDALLNYFGSTIETYEDSDQKRLDREAECEFHGTHYLNGITNAEYIYCFFQIITEMLSDDAAQLDIPMYKEAVLASILEGMGEEFLDLFNEEDFDLAGAQDIWELWKACRNNQKLPLWTDDNDQPVDPPPLAKIPRDEWQYMLEFIQDEFLWDRDWELDLFGGNFSLVTPQPHWPTHQEYRTAKTWLMNAYSNTRANRKEKN